ncbi:MAG: hypothetical protein AAB562_03170 [Patescibacteria group bacterium]
MASIALDGVLIRDEEKGLWSPAQSAGKRFMPLKNNFFYRNQSYIFVERSVT